MTTTFSPKIEVTWAKLHNVSFACCCLLTPPILIRSQLGKLSHRGQWNATVTQQQVAALTIRAALERIKPLIGGLVLDCYYNWQTTVCVHGEQLGGAANDCGGSQRTTNPTDEQPSNLLANVP
eukprot:Gb_34702 [translate_table: standard]